MYRPSKNVEIILAKMVREGFSFCRPPMSLLRLGHDGLVDVFLVTQTGEEDLGIRFGDHTPICRTLNRPVIDMYEEVTLAAPVAEVARSDIHVYETDWVHHSPRRLGLRLYAGPTWATSVTKGVRDRLLCVLP